VPDNLEERTLAGLHAFLAGELAALPRSTPVLDVGCGSGAWLARLKQLGFTDLTGVDAGTRPSLDGVTFIQADLDEGPLPVSRTFRLVTMIEVIEHLANPGLAFAHLAAHLSDGGFALVTSPNIHALRCRLKFLLTGRLASFDEKGDPTHTTPFFLPGARKVAQRHGLEISLAWTYPPRQTLMFGVTIRSAAAVLRAVMPDPLPGDTLCLRIENVRSGAVPRPAG